MLHLLLVLLLVSTQAWATTQWRNGTGINTILGSSNASDIDSNSYNNIVKPLDDLLSNYHQSLGIYYSSASALTVSPGSVMVSNSDGSIRLTLYNSTSTSIDFTNIDTGAEASSTTYYVYAIAASASATSATFKISANSTSPSGATYWKKIGTFVNNSSSDINAASITTEPYGNSVNDSNGAPMVQAIYDYGTSTSSFTNKTGALKVAFGQAGSIAASGSIVVSNLPFTSSSSYQVTTSIATDSPGMGCKVTNQSGSSTTIYANNVSAGSNSSITCNWIAVGI